MKIIIFGLGNFGTPLALNLTETGNEVIGVDLNMDKVNLVKEKISHAICMDSTNELAYRALPIKEADMVVVAIGENEGAAIITTAIIKKLSKAVVISRSLSPIHDTVLQAMGIEKIVHPEQEAAERLTNKINFKKVVENFEIDTNYSISEIKAQKEFLGKTIEEVRFRETHRLNIITIIRRREKTNLIGSKMVSNEVIGLPTRDTKIEEGDVLVVFGLNKDISNLLENY
ncbi:MAG: TrkA family potassium uptake protein [Flavobacteriaceae bacterium]|nr:TrkA family potassium uptake protein [Flavobacteriaceae bacterium]